MRLLVSPGGVSGRAEAVARSAAHSSDRYRVSAKKMGNPVRPPHMSDMKEPSGKMAVLSDQLQGTIMFATLDTLFIGLGIAAYVSAHAYLLLVLKAPAAKQAYEQSRRQRRIAHEQEK